MGITRGELGLLASRARTLGFSGQLLCLGRQDIHFDARLADRVLKAHGITPRLPWPGGALDDVAFFKGLGFDAVSSVDHSDFEGATLVHNLNFPLEPEHHGRFDWIVDGGTSEHVFDFPQALRNYHALLRPGGRIIHIVPASNALNHGFYSFSPTLFRDYYATNGWRILELDLFAYRPYTWSLPFDVYRYEPEAFLSLELSGALPSGRSFGVFCVAEKTDRSTCDVAGVIQQCYLPGAPRSQGRGRSRNPLRRLLRAFTRPLRRILLAALPARGREALEAARWRMRARRLLRSTYLGSP